MFKPFLSVLTLLFLVLFKTGVFAQSPETQNAMMADLSRRVGVTVTFSQVSGSGWTWIQGPYSYVVGAEDGCPAAPASAPVEGNWNRYTINYQNVTFKYIVSDNAQSVILCNAAEVQGTIPTAIPTAAPTATILAPVGAVCDMPPRLTTGGNGRVTPGDPNWLHAEARRSGAKVGEIPGDGLFSVLEGPVCDTESGINYWRVRYGDLEGWTGEGLAGEYWVVSSGVSPINRLTLSQINALPALANIQRQHTGGIQASTFSVDGSLLATADTQNIYVWEIADLTAATAQPSAMITNVTDVHKLVFNPSSDQLAAVTEGLIRFWDLQFVDTGNDSVLRVTDAGGMGAGGGSEGAATLIDMAYSPDGTVVVMATDRTITLMDITVPGGDTARTFSIEGLASIRFSPDGTVLFGLDADGNLIGLWGVSAAARG